MGCCMIVLEVKNFSVYTVCHSCIVGEIYTTCSNFSNMFVAGTYWLKGEIDSGGWAFAHTLICSNRKKTILEKQTQYYFQGKQVSLNELQTHTWYLGEYDRSQHKTVKELVEKGLKKTGLPYSSEDIRQLFHIAPERYERNTRHVGFELFSCRAAIGFANGKDIYAFPWLSQKQQADKIPFIRNICLVLKNHQKLVLLPALSLENAEEIVDYTYDFSDMNFYSY